MNETLSLNWWPYPGVLQLNFYAELFKVATWQPLNQSSHHNFGASNFPTTIANMKSNFSHLESNHQTTGPESNFPTLH